MPVSSIAPIDINARLSGKHILLTGTTGFVGKVVLEKLLRAVPDIGSITLLIRSNSKHRTAEDRFFAEVGCSSIFERLKEDRRFEMLVRSKLRFVSGELTTQNFGLSEGSFKALGKRLDAVINCAASVNFREALDAALEINTLCLKNLVELTAVKDHLPICQVSTCYVSGFTSGHIYEQMMEPAGKPIPDIDALISDMQSQIETLRQKHRGEVLENALIDLGLTLANRHGWNDTYTFTKWLGEQLLARDLADRSLTILRPSIIESCLEEPVAGWIEGVKVADAIIMGWARRKVSIFPGRRKSVVDIIPADLVSNGIIIALAEQMPRAPRHRIYQVCSGSSQPITLGEFIDYCLDEGGTGHVKYPNLFIKPPKAHFRAINRAVFNQLMAVLQSYLSITNKLRGLFGLPVNAKKARNTDVAVKLAIVFGFYTSPNYIFHNERLMDLHRRLATSDQSVFPVDARRIDWKTYIQKIHLRGLDRYALKPKAIREIGLGEVKVA